MASGGPGELVCLDSFFIRKFKGVGKVYQFTAIDAFTCFAVTSIVLGTPAAKELRHVRIRPARPTTTRSASVSKAPCSRSAGPLPSTVGPFTSIRQLQAEADAWLITYNHRRRNHSDYMRGRTPHETLDNHKRNKAA